MSFKRKVRYSNLVALRSLKRNVTIEAAEKFGYIVLTVAVFLGLKASFVALV